MQWRTLRDHVQELVGLVVSQGFRAQVKPESWAATHAADRLVRATACPPTKEPLSPGPAAHPRPASAVGGGRSVHGL
jgi:hypothetical protein